LEDGVDGARHAGLGPQPRAGACQALAERLELLPGCLDRVAADRGIADLLVGAVVPEQPEPLGVGHRRGTGAHDVGRPVAMPGVRTAGHLFPPRRVLLDPVLEPAVLLARARQDGEEPAPFPVDVPEILPRAQLAVGDVEEAR